MRATAPGRPFQGRLGQSPTLKIKGLQVQRPHTFTTNKQMWTDWQWDAWIQPSIRLALAKGANTVRIPGCSAGVVQGMQTRTDFHDKIRQILDYTAEHNLLVYWTSHMPFAGDDLNPSDAATIDEIVAMMQLVGSYRHVVGNDCSNEAVLNVGDAQAWANQQIFYPQIKAVAPDLPLSVSFLVSEAGGFAFPALAKYAPYIDFWDFHPYYGTGDPVNADLDNFRSQTYYKPFLFGESGQADFKGQAAQTSRWTATGALAAAASDCYGAIGYTITDTDADNGDFGMFSRDGLFTERTWISGAFAGWPGSY